MGWVTCLENQPSSHPPSSRKSQSQIHLNHLLHHSRRIQHTTAMPSKLTLLALFAAALGTTYAQNIKATAYTEENCEGSTFVFSENQVGPYCFPNVGGNSIGSFVQSPDAECVYAVQTWSGDNCEGSSRLYVAPTPGSPVSPCYNVPFASVELICVGG